MIPIIVSRSIIEAFAGLFLKIDIRVSQMILKEWMIDCRFSNQCEFHRESQLSSLPKEVGLA